MSILWDVKAVLITKFTNKGKGKTTNAEYQHSASGRLRTAIKERERMRNAFARNFAASRQSACTLRAPRPSLRRHATSRCYRPTLFARSVARSPPVLKFEEGYAWDGCCSGSDLAVKLDQKRCIWLSHKQENFYQSGAWHSRLGFASALAYVVC
jgi:hypothetical protein